ncbi:hypothetical protein BHU72_14245 [Desulfuribacillus stibiiarsenatis]|uniref:OmpR/PhoB-type domain-containing protein n=1 Tax=Desulfuribacillus stibiiarsenatis TaxID=1390249 RepID=A0A1E5L7G5_9FIRM|nr:helix-turn-helix domain-containing protein [Desulfuribacillus stibiiarsenatis]OEH86085.1 hypothetical protein BHU72_14245 [Desulfuribacillus stibiiarsenatis]
MADPDNQLQYRMELAEIHVELAYFRKKKSEYQKASEHLWLARNIDPQNPRPYFHLAHIAKLYGDDMAVIEDGETAIALQRFDELSDVRKIKLYCLLAVSYSRNLQDSKGQEYITKAVKLNEKLGYLEITLIENAIASMNSSPNKPYLLVTNKGERKLYDSEGRDEFLEDIDNRHILILDNTQQGPYVQYNQKTITIQPVEARILQLLLQHNEPVSKEQIKEFVWLDNNRDLGDSTIRKNISKIRAKLRSILKDSVENNSYIINVNGRYIWSIEINIAIFTII